MKDGQHIPTAFMTDSNLDVAAVDGKPDESRMAALPTMAIDRARPVLGDLATAAANNERTVLTLYRRPTAAIVSIRDLRRLMALEDDRPDAA